MDTKDANDAEKIEEAIGQLAEQFGIREQDYRINEDYLWANYVDPSFVPIMVLIMFIIIMAGIITIYSIYYISMGERVQEFGKIKAIGATTGQLRRIVLLEGFLVAGIAIPFGLLMGTLLVRGIFLSIFQLYQSENDMMSTIQGLVQEGEVQLIIPWIYLLAVGVAMITVFLSLLRPMRIAAKVSEIEAMRYTGEYTGKKRRKGYCNMTVPRLSMIHLAGNRKKSLITICSMAITGLFFMVVATVLACADPDEAADNSMLGEYRVSPIIEFGNKEHPELEWSQVLKNNPLTEELKEQILQIDGIQSIESYPGTFVVSDAFAGDREGVLGIPACGKELLEEGIIEGNVTYEELKSGDKVVIDNILLNWYPDLKVGDVIEVSFLDGEKDCRKQLEIAAIGDYPIGFTRYQCLLMAEEGLYSFCGNLTDTDDADKYGEEGLRSFSGNNLNRYYHIYADKKYDVEVEAKLKEIAKENGRIKLETWKTYYDEWNAGMKMTRSACYAFLGILGAICIMNMINTMIHSVHVRKKEIGMLQAVGMSNLQLQIMLQLEGLFYTIGTLIIAVGGGSAVGYPVFLWAKKGGMFNIRDYHYPLQATFIMVAILVVVQIIMIWMIGKSVKKDSLIDRIRFDN